ncbi:MAG: methylmalonyl-CoA mutase family protein [Chloroflexi bacterium]|nr:methylmalonyl-CoA mutase family protein [Chloroflexota bacterium]
MGAAPREGDAVFERELLAALQEREAQAAARLQNVQERQEAFRTLSGIPVDRVATPTALAGTDYLRDVGLPGEYPYLRGLHPTGYRGRLWTMRMFAGFGTAVESNARYRSLLAHGETGLSVAFDLPTLMGYDTDHPAAAGEFGRCGVAVSSLADMEVLFDGIPLDQVTTSMTINSPAAVIWAMYLAAAARRGIPLASLGGTLQNDILKEYMAQNEYIFPPEPSLRLVVDTVAFSIAHLPRWNPISVSGYHIREAGATAVQELAFTLANGTAYVEACRDRGLAIDDFAPRLSFFFNCHLDFFEEIAKFRAARRLWARIMRERYGARQERSCWLRFHTQTAGCSLMAQQPWNNVVRVAFQALAAVLGGTQSLHTNALDEALALPSEAAARLALRTQQILAYETGVANSVDPLGGSYLVETLTNQMEEAAQGYLHRIASLGGVIPAMENGFFHREIAEAAFRFQQAVEDQARLIVGVNAHVEAEPEPLPVPLLELDAAAGLQRQLARLAQVRRTRDNRAVAQRLRDLAAVARSTEQVMPAILDAVTEYATLGEVCDVLRDVFGEYAGDRSF